MGKKNKVGSGLGNALINDRFSNVKNRREHAEGMIHSTDLNDGYDWGRLNLQSVTEESSFQVFWLTVVKAWTEQPKSVGLVVQTTFVCLITCICWQEFLSTAELAGTEFEAEKLNLRFVKPTADRGILHSADEIGKVNKEVLKIPRRPAWDRSTTPEELNVAERESFLQWRRTLAVIQDEQVY